MATRVGVGVSASAVRVVVTKGFRVRWHSQRSLTKEKPLEETLAEILEAAPIKSWRGLPAFVSVGPSLSIVRRLSGLPPISSDTVALEMVRSNVDRFLPRIPETSCVGAAMSVTPGEIWIATFDESCIDSVRRACESANVRLRCVAPASFVLASTLAEQSTHTRMRWSDGKAAIEMEVRGGKVSDVTRLRPTDVDHALHCDDPPLCEHLRQLGAESSSFADAYGAALLGGRVPLGSTTVGMAHRIPLGVPRWRLALAATAVVLGLVAATSAPILGAVVARIEDSTRLRLIADSAQAGALVASELRQLDASARALSEFEATRVSPSLLLAGITRSLPKGTALVAFAFDSSGGSLVAIGPNVLGVVASLDSVEKFGIVRAASPVTKETSNGLPLERIAVAFTLRGAVARAAARVTR